MPEESGALRVNMKIPNAASIKYYAEEIESLSPR
jgi:hypothetical protein